MGAELSKRSRFQKDLHAAVCPSVVECLHVMHTRRLKPIKKKKNLCAVGASSCPKSQAPIQMPSTHTPYRPKSKTD